MRSGELRGYKMARFVDYEMVLQQTERLLSLISEIDYCQHELKRTLDWFCDFNSSSDSAGLYDLFYTSQDINKVFFENLKRYATLTKERCEPIGQSDEQ